MYIILNPVYSHLYIYLSSHLPTAWFEKVYRTIFQRKRRRLVLKTGVIIYIQNDTYFLCVISIERWLMRPLLLFFRYTFLNYPVSNYPCIHLSILSILSRRRAAPWRRTTRTTSSRRSWARCTSSSTELTTSTRQEPFR